MNKKWVVFLFFAVFLTQCKKSLDKNGTQTPVALAAACEKKVILNIAAVALTNQDFKNFITLQYADMFEKQNNEKLLSRLFDIFCEQQLILFKANQDGIRVEEEEIAHYLMQVQNRGQNSALDRKMIGSVLKVQKYLLATAYKNIEVSASEVATFYEGHLSEFGKTEEIELFQIMVKDREKLLDLRSELLGQPSRFEEIARSESLAPEAAKGGAMGLFEKGILPQEMEEVVFSLKVNEISPIVESPYGFHLFKVTKKKSSRMRLLSEVTDEIRNKLLSAKLATAYREFLFRLRSEIPVQLHPENLYFPYLKSDSGANP
jgi:parvulin-like peptidyl-prolyl isomerase